MSSHPYETPKLLPCELNTAATGRFGWWGYFTIHLLFVLAIAIPSIQIAVEDAREFASDPATQSKVGPSATLLYLACKYLPMLAISPWLGRWVQRRISKSWWTVFWVLPTATAVSALVMVLCVNAISLSRSISVDFLTLPPMYFALLLPIHVVGVCTILCQIAIVRIVRAFRSRVSGQPLTDQ